ncbi:MAG: hypothetical protein Q4C50_03145 [Eubacteriales bacterium]|nr:hypothetical protein [Eubacteriales bacterium]
MKRCRVIDIGASSGRHIVGWRKNGEIGEQAENIQKLYQFGNAIWWGLPHGLSMDSFPKMISLERL